MAILKSHTVLPILYVTLVAFAVQWRMTTSNAPSKQEIVDHAISAFGMRTWIAKAYADIETANAPENQSSSSTLRACTKLTQDDSGSVDPLVSALANEVLRLNKSAVALAPNPEAAMLTVLDLLGLQYAEPEEKQKLLNALSAYVENHEFSSDGDFKQYAKALDGAALDPSFEP